MFRGHDAHPDSFLTRLFLQPGPQGPLLGGGPHPAQELSDPISGHLRPPALPFAPLGLAIILLSHSSVPLSAPPCDLGL